MMAYRPVYAAYDGDVRNGCHTHYQRVRNEALRLTSEERHRLFIELSHEYVFELACYMAWCCVCGARAIGDRYFNNCIYVEECESYVCNDCLGDVEIYRDELGEIRYECQYHRNPTLKSMALMHIKYEQ